MNKIVCYILILLPLMGGIGPLDKGAPKDRLLKFKEGIDEYDITLRDRPIIEKDMNKWWLMTEDFIFSIFNENSNNDLPLDYLFKETIVPEGMTLTGSQDQGATIYYSYSCGPHGAPHEFGLRIIPMDLDRDIYYINYSKSWWDFPNCEGDQKSGGKSFILEKNRKSRKYEITAWFEKSNFYRDLVSTGKLGEMVGIEGDPYGSTGGLETKYDPISSVNGDLLFNTKLLNCKPMGPSCHKMYLYWVYDKNKKLRCLYYLDDYVLEKDPQTGKLRPMGKKVELAP